VRFIEPKSSKILFLPSTSTQSELPNCSICLEPLDEIKCGLVTILCNHSFHFECLSRCKEENRCPVCRYPQLPSGKNSSCHGCGTTENLWICLICGYIGCSRYQNKHSENHFIETKHTYALEMDTQKCMGLFH